MSVINPLLGKYVTACSLQVQAVATTGALTASVATVNLATLVTTTGVLHSNLAFTVGLLDELDLQFSKTTENIRPMNRTRAHHVPLTLSAGFTVSEILQSNGATSNQLAGIWHKGETKIVLLTFAAARRKYLVYGVMTDYVETLAQGKNVGRLTCRPCNVGTSTVTISTGADR